MSSARVWTYLVASVIRDVEIEGPFEHDFDPALLEHVAKTIYTFEGPCAVYIFGAPVDRDELGILVEGREAILHHRWCMARATKDTVHGGLSVTMNPMKLKEWFGRDL